jgi:hypothetical protein
MPDSIAIRAATRFVSGTGGRFFVERRKVVCNAEGDAVRDRVELIVQYEADGAEFLPRIRGEKLLEFKLNGQVVDPPAPNLSEIYRWLGVNGYVPDKFTWIDRHEGRRRRRQVYIYQPHEPIPERGLTHAQAWDLSRGYRIRDL